MMLCYSAGKIHMNVAARAATELSGNLCSIHVLLVGCLKKQPKFNKLSPLHGYTFEKCKINRAFQPSRGYLNEPAISDPTGGARYSPIVKRTFLHVCFNTAAMIVEKSFPDHVKSGVIIFCDQQHIANKTHYTRTYTTNG